MTLPKSASAMIRNCIVNLKYAQYYISIDSAHTTSTKRGGMKGLQLGWMASKSH